MSVRNTDDLLIQALEQASVLYDEGKEIEAYLRAISGVNEYFYRLGMPWNLMRPLDSLRNTLFDGATFTGKRKRPSGETSAFADAAAVVTVLKERGWTVAEAVKKVAIAAQLDAKKLSSFRDNINRGLHDEYTRYLYPQMLEFRRSQDISDEELLTVLISNIRRKKP